MKSSLLAAVLLVAPSVASARNIQAGSMWLRGGIGAGIPVGGALDTNAVLALHVGGEYAVRHFLGVIADVTTGIPGTVPLRFHLGGRYRFGSPNWPLSPYVDAALTVGGLFGSLGANLWLLGGRVGGGADYFLTARLAAGATLDVDIDSTLGVRPAFYGSVDILLYAAYAF